MSHKWNFGTPEEKYRLMIADYRNGMSMEDMRLKYDYTTITAVRHALRKQGELPQAPGRWTEKPLDVPKVLALQAAGWPIGKIVDEFNNEYSEEQIIDAVNEYDRRHRYGNVSDKMHGV